MIYAIKRLKLNLIIISDGMGNISKIIIVTTMITRGGSHSENEIPEELQALRQKHSDIDIEYAWPFSMDAFALFLTDHIKNYNPTAKVSSD